MKKRLTALMLVLICCLTTFALTACTYQVNEKESLLVGEWAYEKTRRLYFFKDGTISQNKKAEGKARETYRYTETKTDDFGEYYEYETNSISSYNQTIYIKYYPETDELYYGGEHNDNESAIALTRCINE